ncbi:RDD family protein [Foetidibacter luteolus]|uniref:RDD family protein n=1 Tax=Foetidibacter luteolus TaxID=2608880 RepID=UPI001A9941DF|nr:RDD family protein [Foetidibacter luteolus]
MTKSSVNYSTGLKRFIAYLIDFLICILLFWGYAELFYKKTGIRTYQSIGIPPVIALPLIMFAYYSLQEYFFQQTIGKYIFKLRVIKIDHSKLKFADLVKRHFFDFIELLLFPAIIPIVLELINKKQQRLGDMFAKTRVERITK